MITRYSLFSSVSLLLVAYLIIGVSHIAFLPPWEGFDETAHYSYLQQLSDSHKLPERRNAKISKDVENYTNFAPMPYSTNPPFENNGGFTYKNFFESPDSVVEKGRAFVGERPHNNRNYETGNGFNWQSQHPPLYYIIMSPIYLMTKHLSWRAHIFILRFVSYIFAWLALVIGIRKCYALVSLNHDSSGIYRWTMLGIVIWPILFPSWFFAMARIGNDSLCALFMSLIWTLLLKSHHVNGSLKHSFFLGILMAFGCLVKAFFIPLSIGILGYWIFLHIYSNENTNYNGLIGNLILMLIIIFVISGWWYLGNLYHYGVLIGSDEMIMLKNKGGLLHGLLKNFSPFAFVRGYIAFVATMIWCGTWSWARVPYIYLVPMVFFAVFLFISYIALIKRYSIISEKWIPLWCMLPIFMGFSFHILVRIALTGEGRGTGGYYMNFLVAPLGMAIGLVLFKNWSKFRFRLLFYFIICYSFSISVFTMYAQILLYSGIVYKSGSIKFYQFSQLMPALLGLPLAIKRLDGIAFPYIGFISWFAGNFLILLVLLYNVRFFKSKCTVNDP